MRGRVDGQAVARLLVEYVGGRRIEHHEPSFWLRSRLLDLETRLLSGDFAVCVHLRPDEVGLTTLTADTVVCGNCMHRIYSAEHDRRCGRCAGSAVAYTEIVPTANAVVFFDLCATCRRKEVGA